MASGWYIFESIILALQLNRTLCIPAFFKHKSDDSASVLKDFGVVDQSEALIDAKYRIDLDKLKHLMTICDLEKIQSNCDGRIHAVFNARVMCNKWRIGQINTFRELCGILPFTDANCQPRDGVGHYPKDSFTAKMVLRNTYIP